MTPPTTTATDTGLNLNLSDRLGVGRDGADQDEINVEFWGPPGSGKTLLLVSLYETLLHKDELGEDTLPPELLDIRERVIHGQSTPMTLPSEARPPDRKEGEKLTIPIKMPDNTSRRVSIRAHAGEDLRYRGGIDVPRFIDERRNKVFVACLNPFRVDSQLAWKGLQNMIAVLQSDRIGLDLPTAVEQAVWTLFQLDPDITRKRQPLNRLLTQFKARMLYDPSRTESEGAFGWDTGNNATVKQINDQLRALIDERIAEQAPLLNTVRQALKRLPHSMVVLTHIDIIDALLPSITFSDIQRVFDYLYIHRPERMVNQQALARPFDVSITSMFGSDFGDIGAGFGGSNGKPAAGLEPLGPPRPAPAAGPAPAPAADPAEKARGEYSVRGMITGKLRKDGATPVVSYIKAIASLGRVDSDLNVTISHLRQQINTLKEDLQIAKNHQNQLGTQLQETVTQREDLARRLVEANKSLTTLTSDYHRLIDDVKERDRSIAEIKAQLEANENERARLTGELESAQKLASQQAAQLGGMPGLQDRSRELHAALEKERAQHEQARKQFAELRQQLAGLGHEKDELQTGLRRSEADVEELRAEVARLGGGELDRLKQRLSALGQDRDALAARWEQAERDRQELDRKLTDALSLGEASQAERAKLADLVAAWRRKAEDIRAQAQAAIAQRDAAIDELRQRIQAADTKVTATGKELAEARLGTLTADEKRARDDYEGGRMGPTKWWALLMLRALPAMPVIACLMWAVLFVAFEGSKVEKKNLFLASSLGTLLVVGSAFFAGIIVQWRQLGPRWIWLRSMNTQSRKFETLTSAGERVAELPEGFILEKSPLLSLLGLGAVRRADTGQRYVTTEPGAWLAAPERPRVHTAMGWDVLTLLVTLAWVGSIIYLTFKAG